MKPYSETKIGLSLRTQSLTTSLKFMESSFLFMTVSSSDTVAHSWYCIPSPGKALSNSGKWARSEVLPLLEWNLIG